MIQNPKADKTNILMFGQFSLPVSLKEEENFEVIPSNQTIIYGHTCTHRELNRRQVIQPLLNI